MYNNTEIIEENGVFRAEHTVDISGAVEAVKHLRDNWKKGQDDLRHIMEIPAILVEQYCFQNGVKWSEFWQDPKHMKRIINDPDLAAFRVAPGRY